MAPETGMGATIVPPHDEALLAWRAWCAAHIGQRCRLNLSSRWQFSMVLDGSSGPKTHQHAEQTASRNWQHYFGIDEQTWKTDWITRTAALDGKMLVLALPRLLMDDVLTVARRQGVHVIWAGPWWLRGALHWLDLARKGDGQPRSLSMGEPGWSVTLTAEGHGLTSINSAPSDNGLPILPQGHAHDVAQHATLISLPSLSGHLLWSEDRALHQGEPTNMVALLQGVIPHWPAGSGDTA